MFVLIEDNKNRAKHLHFQHLKHLQNKTAVCRQQKQLKCEGKQKGRTHRSAPTSLSIKEALLKVIDNAGFSQPKRHA